MKYEPDQCPQGSLPAFKAATSNQNGRCSVARQQATMMLLSAGTSRPAAVLAKMIVKNQLNQGLLNHGDGFISASPTDSSRTSRFGLYVGCYELRFFAHRARTT